MLISMAVALDTPEAFKQIRHAILVAARGSHVCKKVQGARQLTSALMMPSRNAAAFLSLMPPNQSPSQGLIAPYTNTLPAYCIPWLF